MSIRFGNKMVVTKLCSGWPSLRTQPNAVQRTILWDETGRVGIKMWGWCKLSFILTRSVISPNMRPLEQENQAMERDPFVPLIGLYFVFSCLRKIYLILS